MSILEFNVTAAYADGVAVLLGAHESVTVLLWAWDVADVVGGSV